MSECWCGRTACITYYENGLVRWALCGKHLRQTETVVLRENVYEDQKNNPPPMKPRYAQLEAENERMRLIVDAALSWAAVPVGCSSEEDAAEIALLRAVQHYRSETGGGE